MENEAREEAAQRGDSEYEPPAIERVMGQEELEREVHYAGVIDPSRVG